LPCAYTARTRAARIHCNQMLNPREVYECHFSSEALQEMSSEAVSITNKAIGK